MINRVGGTAASLVAAGLLASGPASAGSTEVRVLRKQVVVCAPLEAVWDAWTTPEGTEFASARSNIALEIGGPYEWFTDGPADELGVRGSEGSRVLAFLEQEMLAFDWTFPPDIPTLRKSGAKTQVVVLLTDLGDGRVRVRLAQHGWQEGEDWEAGWAYFDAAWGSVLELLEQSFEGGQSTCREPGRGERS